MIRDDGISTRQSEGRPAAKTPSSEASFCSLDNLLSPLPKCLSTKCGAYDNAKGANATFAPALITPPRMERMGAAGHAPLISLRLAPTRRESQLGRAPPGGSTGVVQSFAGRRPSIMSPASAARARTHTLPRAGSMRQHCSHSR